MFKKIILIFLVALLAQSISSRAAEFPMVAVFQNSTSELPLNESQSLPDLQTEQHKRIKLLHLLQQATAENKKVTAAILTLTLGMLGVHRIYLGTAPYIPAVYLFTFGGGFFILPLIDLVMIITTNDISKFENNNKLLMWTGE